jgi:hypothetical protein
LKVNVESDLQRLRDRGELTNRRVAAPGLERSDYRLGDPEPLGELNLRQPDALACKADSLPYELRVDCRSTGPRHS